MSEVQTFPDLPVDMARYILETAAFDWRDASRLVLVSKAVREWIDPILYHTVVITCFDDCKAFANTIRSRNDPSFFARHVKRLCVYEDAFDAQDITCIFDILTGLHCLAWWLDIYGLLPYMNTSLASVRYFSTTVELDSPHTIEAEFPRNITHLNVAPERTNGPLGDNSTAVWKAIFTRCPSLTHIVVDFCPSHHAAWTSNKEAFVHSALSVAPATLKAFIIEFLNAPPLFPWDASDFGPFLTDSRFIIVSPDPAHSGLEGVVCYPVYHDPLLDWEHQDATMDIWEFVDMHRSPSRANEPRAEDGGSEMPYLWLIHEQKIASTAF